VVTRDAVIVAAVRTPIGKRNGALRSVHPVDLSAHVLRALVERTGIDPGQVNDVIWGCVSQVGEQTYNVGRSAVLAAGWPDEVPATTVDRQCGSSQQAAEFAAAGVIAGRYDVAVAGGVESMTRVPLGSSAQVSGAPFGQTVLDRYHVDLFHQGLGAEQIADKWGIGRARADDIGLESHRRAVAAIDEGRFAAQIAPIEITDEDSASRLFKTDEGPRRGGTPETVAGVRPAFRPDGVHTAANSSQISDGAAALLITTSETARSLGLRPLVRFQTSVVLGVDPVTMLTGPIPATAAALKKSGLRIEDIGAFEVNEAFASVLGAWQIETGADPARVNPNGGAIALGHPLGATGARLMTSLVYHLIDNEIDFGLQTMCEGGGMANATILERIR
jgi:acetyl-CoA acyltransferase